MRKILLTVLSLMTFSLLAYSQMSDTLKSKRILITTSLLDYYPTFRLNTGNFNIGSEIFLKKKKSIYVNVGMIRSYGPSNGMLSINSEKTQGMKIQVEGRYYLNKHKIFEPALFLFWPHIFQYKSQTLQNTGYYLAVHSHYQLTTTDRQETIVDYIDNNPFPNTSHYKQNMYTVDRTVYALHLKFGYQCIKKVGLTINYGVGLGIQYISSSSKNRLGNDFSWPNSERDYGNKLFDKGTGIAPSFVYHVRLGWAL